MWPKQKCVSWVNYFTGLNLRIVISGLLLRQMATDPLLSQYSVVVIDEVCQSSFQI